jgi:nitrogen regulatory protein P-II
MTKIDAIVREDVYEEIKEALDGLGVHGMTISQVMGCGIQGGYTSIVRGSRVDIQMLPKIKFEIVVSSQKWADKVVETICSISRTGKPGDGKIFIYDLKDAVRIRTGERGNEAIY